MLLCDTIHMIASDPKRYRHIDESQNVAVKWFSEQLSKSVRYVLDDAVLAHSGAAMQSRIDTFESCVKTLRFPHQNMWIEFNDIRRRVIRAEQRLDWDRGSGDRPSYDFFREAPDIVSRVGFLISTDEHGRSGNVHYVWQYRGQFGPEMGSVCHYFDLDNDGSSMVGAMGITAVRSHSVMHDSRIVVDPQELGYLGNICVTRHSHWMEKEFGELFLFNRKKYLQEFCMMASNIECEFSEVLSSVIMIVARNGSDKKLVSRAKINRSREKTRKSPLLDHYTVTMRISGLEKKRGVTGSVGYSVPKRAHLVAGHYVVRKVPKETIFYRRGHMRGLSSGLPPAVKTIRVIP